MIFVKKSRMYKTLLRQKFLLNKMVPPLLVVMVAPLGSLTIMLGMLTNYLKRTCLWHHGPWLRCQISKFEIYLENKGGMNTCIVVYRALKMYVGRGELGILLKKS